MRPEDKQNVFISGIFLCFLFILCGIIISMLGKDQAFFEGQSAIKTYVKNAQNLKIGAAVQLKGIRVGTLESIEFIELNKIELILKIKSKYLNWIRKDSYIEVKTQGVLGDKLLEILGGTTDSVAMNDGDIIETLDQNSFDKLLNRGEDIMVTADRLLKKLDIIFSNVDEQTVAISFKNLEKSLETLNNTVKQLNVKNLNKSFANMEKVSKHLEFMGARINEGPGTLHSLIYDRTVYDDLQTLLGGAKRNKVLKYF